MQILNDIQLFYHEAIQIRAFNFITEMYLYSIFTTYTDLKTLEHKKYINNYVIWDLKEK